MIKAKLIEPLSFDVAKFASYLPEYIYKGPTIPSLTAKPDFNEYIRDPNDDYKIVIKFSKPTIEGFLKIESSYTFPELRIKFANINQHIKQPLYTALSHAGIDVTAMSEKQTKILNKKIEEHNAISDLKIPFFEGKLIKTKNSEIEERNADSDLLKRFNAKGISNFKIANFDINSTQGIVQGQVGYTNNKNNTYILGTTCVHTCVALALYNPQTYTVGLAHIDNGINMHSISSMVYHVKDESEGKIHAHLYGGYENQSLTIKLLKTLAINDMVVIKSCSLSHAHNHVVSLAINARNGEVYHNFSNDKLN